MKTPLVFLMALLYVLIISGTVSATNSTLYVDVNTGSDSNDGSLAHPWSTINHAATQVETGDTVLIADGNYFINENIHITTSGSSNNPVTFKGEGDGVVIDASGLDGSSYDKRDAILVENANYVTIENLEIKNAFRAGIRVSESDYVHINNVTSHDNGNWGIFTGFSNYLLIENCECYGSMNEHGIYTSNSGDNPIIRGNKIHDNNGCGLHMNGDISMGGDGVISNALVENNVIYNNGVGGGSGINCDGVTNSIIRNNLLYNNHASGISLYCIDGGAESTNNQVYHNTVIVASDGRWALNLQDGHNKIYNNIFLNNNPYHGSITTASVIGLESDYNIITTNSHPVTPDDESTYPSFSQWQALGFDLHSIQANANQLFTNPSFNDYSLKTGSLAQDKGTSQYTYSKDILGNKRPQGTGYDIGAFETLIPQLTKITNNTNDQNNPTIYGDVVVWQDNRYGNWEIMMKDIITNIESRVTFNSHDQRNPSIYNNLVVWEDNRYGNWEIMMKNLTSNLERRITTNSHDQLAPSIYGTKIVWQDDRYGNWEIMMRDLSNNIESRVTKNTHNQINPSIYGNLVVWQDDRYGNWEIMMKNLTTNTESRVTMNSKNQTNPGIFEDKVVWQDNRYGNNEIMMKNLTTSTESRITNNIKDQNTPAIYQNKIVWECEKDIYIWS